VKKRSRRPSSGAAAGRRASRQQRGTVSVVLGGLAVVAVLVAVLVLNGQRDARIASAASAATATASAAASTSSVPHPTVPRISPPDAKARWDTGAAIFVDVRSAESFKESHIRNARLLPVAEIESRYAELPRDAEIILYCT
jgi:hypothetical protein